jgi:hypothetical protein
MSVRPARTASSQPLASRPLLRVRADRKCGKGLIIDRPRDLGRLVGHRVRVELRVVKGIWHADVVLDAWNGPAALVSVGVEVAKALTSLHQSPLRDCPHEFPNYCQDSW